MVVVRNQGLRQNRIANSGAIGIEGRVKSLTALHRRNTWLRATPNRKLLSEPRVSSKLLLS